MKDGIYNVADGCLTTETDDYAAYYPHDGYLVPGYATKEGAQRDIDRGKDDARYKNAYVVRVRIEKV